MEIKVKKDLPLGEGSNASECLQRLLQIIRLLPRTIEGKEEAVEVGLALRHEIEEILNQEMEKSN